VRHVQEIEKELPLAAGLFSTPPSHPSKRTLRQILVGICANALENLRRAIILSWRLAINIILSQQFAIAGAATVSPCGKRNGGGRGGGLAMAVAEEATTAAAAQADKRQGGGSGAGSKLDSVKAAPFCVLCS
jgi:hypothetical protein